MKEIKKLYLCLWWKATNKKEEGIKWEKKN